MATKIVNEGRPYTAISGDESEKLIYYYQQSLNEAKQVDINLLNDRYPEWGSRYKDQYIKGMELIIKGHKDVDPINSMNGQQLVGTWKIWFNNHITEIMKKSDY